jgi:L-threonylcarbamoyladenylate synthase
MSAVSIAALVAAARSGQSLISFPTDTIPALAARPDQAEQIYRAKQRQADKPLILMAARPEDLWPYVAGTESEQKVWQQVAAQVWPGAVTLVLPASDRTPLALHPQDPTTIGVRVPDWAIAQMILQQTGPLATTSVNRSGEKALESFTEIQSAFPDILIPLEHHWRSPTISDSGMPPPESLSPLSTSSTPPSTVVKWGNGDWEILRQGAVLWEKSAMIN